MILTASFFLLLFLLMNQNDNVEINILGEKRRPRQDAKERKIKDKMSERAKKMLVFDNGEGLLFSFVSVSLSLFLRLRRTGARSQSVID